MSNHVRSHQNRFKGILERFATYQIPPSDRIIPCECCPEDGKKSPHVHFCFLIRDRKKRHPPENFQKNPQKFPKIKKVGQKTKKRFVDGEGLLNAYAGRGRKAGCLVCGVGTVQPARPVKGSFPRRAWCDRGGIHSRATCLALGYAISLVVL